MADVVGQVPGQLPTFTSGHNPQAGVPGGGTVTSISGVSPIATVPSPIVGAGTVEFPSWPADAPGELTNDGAGVLSWETDVGNFVRLLADPTIDQDVGGFHVTLSGLSDTAFLVNTLTNAQDAKFRGLGTTKGSLELEYTTVAANNFAGLTLLAPTGAAFVQNLFGSGTSGAAVGWDGGDYDLPSGAVLYGGITESHWFKLSGSTDHCGTFQLYDNGLNFFPALTLVSIDGSPAVGAVTIGANPRINAIPPDFSVFHGATTATGLGTERQRISDQFTNGQFILGDVASFTTSAGLAGTGTLGQFQFWFDAADTAVVDLHSAPSDSGITQLALYAPAAALGGTTNGVHLVARANVAGDEDGAITWNLVDRLLFPAGAYSDSTSAVLQGDPASGSDTQKSTLLWQATDSGTNTSEVSVGIELPNSVGVDGDLVIFTGGVEALRISGVDQKVTMPGVLDPPEIDVINKVPGDMAVAPIFFAATDSGANTSNVSLGIELPNSVGVPGDLVLRAGGVGVNTGGTDWMRMSGVTGAAVFSGTGTPAHVAIGSGVSVDATINLTAILPGVVGNVYTVEIVSGAPTPDVALGVVEAGTVTTITLGTDGAGVLDPAKNTATLVLAELGSSTLFTGALAGTGDDSLTVESQIFFGGAEAITAVTGNVAGVGGIFSGNVDAATFSSAGGDPFVLPAADLGGGGALVTDGSGNVSVATLAVIGTAVSLQVASPGTPDSGNFNVSGAGIIGGISLISSAPGDTATSTLFWSATDSGANTSNVSAGIELPDSVGVAGDLVLRTGGSGASGSGTERVRVLGDGTDTIIGIPVTDSGESLHLGSTPAMGGFYKGLLLYGVHLGETAALGIVGNADIADQNHMWMFFDGSHFVIQTEASPLGVFEPLQLNAVDGDNIITSQLSLDPILKSAGLAWDIPNGYGVSGDVTEFVPSPDNTIDLGASSARWRTIYGGTGHVAVTSIGSGTNGTVNLVADDPGIAGNGFTATVAAGVGLNVPMTAAFTLQALLVTLGTDGAGALDPAKNTATLIAGAINTAAGGVTATASGTGADPLTGAEGPTTFTGGVESLALAGGLSANANIYLTNLPGSDPGIAGALYQTAGAVMVSL